MPELSMPVRTLRKMIGRNYALWMSPEDDHPYWSSRPRGDNDYLVATPWDFLLQAGYDVGDAIVALDDDDDVFTLVF